MREHMVVDSQPDAVPRASRASASFAARLSDWLVLLTFCAGVGLIDATLLTGARRLAHNTYIHVFPWRA
jgi:hypothetical protein